MMTWTTVGAVRNSILILVSIGISLALGELMVRAFIPQGQADPWRVYTASGLFANKSGGTARHVFGERDVLYRFAPPHLRDLDENVPRGGQATRKVLVLGDSFTFGYLLADKDTYVRLLEDDANRELAARGGRFVFLDAAGAGWGIADFLVYLKDYLSQIRPGYVLIFLDTDDVGRSLDSKLVVYRDGLTFPPPRLSGIRQFINDLPFHNALAYLGNHSALLNLVRRFAIALLERNGYDAAPTVTRVTPIVGNDRPAVRDPALLRKFPEAMFDAIVRLCHENGAKLAVLTTGLMSYMNSTNPTRPFYQEAPAFFRDRNVDYIDISDEFAAIAKDHVEDYLIPEDFHSNEKGAEMIAALNWPHLRRILGQP